MPQTSKEEAHGFSRDIKYPQKANVCVAESLVELGSETLREILEHVPQVGDVPGTLRVRLGTGPALQKVHSDFHD